MCAWLHFNFGESLVKAFLCLCLGFCPSLFKQTHDVAVKNLHRGCAVDEERGAEDENRTISQQEACSWVPFILSWVAFQLFLNLRLT